MLRIIALVIILVMAPTVAFFLWAWGVKIKEERKLSGTLPEWQDLPLTWLAIAGLVCGAIGIVAAIAFIALVVTTGDVVTNFTYTISPAG